MKTGQKLTTRLLETPQPARTIIRDTEVRGLFVEYGKPPFVSFKIQADLRRDGKVETVRMKLGEFPAMSVSAARAEAMPLLAQIKKGVDPRKRVPEVAVDGVKPWTVAQGYVEYERYLKTHGSERSITDNQKLYRYLFGPDDPEAPVALVDTTRSELARRGRAKAKGVQLDAPVKKKSTAVPLELGDWRKLPLRSLTKELVIARHAHISEKHGPVQANKVMRMLRAWINHAADSQSIEYPKNPVTSVKFNPENARNRSMRYDELGDWYRRLQTIYNPLRRLMHEFGLLSGLRPTNLVQIEVQWIDFDRRVIQFPASVMKIHRNRKPTPFDLPLSEYMMDVLQRALKIKTAMAPDSPYLFPTVSEEGKVIATTSWQERKGIPKETGNLLRHTYSNMAKNAGVTDTDRELLMAHRIQGIKGRYLDQPALFDTLLAAQEKVSNFILPLIRPAMGLKQQAQKEDKAEKPRRMRLSTEGLLDRAALARVLRVSMGDVGRMVARGAPVITVLDSERFEYKEVLEWLKANPSKGGASTRHKAKALTKHVRASVLRAG